MNAKTFFLAGLLIFNVGIVLAQSAVQDTSSEFATYVKTKDYEGVIFGKMGPANYTDDKEYRWTPTPAEIEEVETLMKKHILKTVRKRGLINQFGDRPVIHENFEKYIRQYMGYINQKGQKIVWVNCFWKAYENEFPDWKTHLVDVMDGGSYFWHIKVNLNNKKCTSYIVNA